MEAETASRRILTHTEIGFASLMDVGFRFAISDRANRRLKYVVKQDSFAGEPWFGPGSSLPAIRETNGPILTREEQKM